MKHNKFKRISTILLCLAAITAMLLTGCVDEVALTEAATLSNQLGEGATAFTLCVIGTDGKEQQFEIRTDETTVGDALTKVGMIEGEQSDYGLYIKTVNGETLDYDTDGKYWAFYIGEEYAMTGVDSTEIVEGQTYTLKAE
ncbi:MAG: DUF4430 domain-containing protein [Ruminococcaceae bacterium]|nr:DUF4430 domain-containing protein [Oscillospiraceae bacterium]